MLRTDQAGRWYFYCPACMAVLGDDEHAMIEAVHVLSEDGLGHDGEFRSENPVHCSGFVRGQQIYFGADCGHEMAGSVCPVPETEDDPYAARQRFAFAVKDLPIPDRLKD